MAKTIDTKETAFALSARIKEAKSKEELQMREGQILRHYNNRTINATQLRRLDVMIMERYARLEPES